jgi:hypothetical protein
MTHRRSRSTVACIDAEEAPVRGRRSSRRGQRSGRGGPPWWRGTRGGVGEQSEDVVAAEL